MCVTYVRCCVTIFSSLTALLPYLVTQTIRAQSTSPVEVDYYNIVETCRGPLEYAYLVFDSSHARVYQQSRFIVPIESGGADIVLIVPEDSGSHRQNRIE